MLVRPTARHTAHHGQGILCRGAAMLARPGLAYAQFGMLATAPVNDEHNFACLVIDIDNDIDDQRA
jgi:hypothetical protein